MKTDHHQREADHETRKFLLNHSEELDLLVRNDMEKAWNGLRLQMSGVIQPWMFKITRYAAIVATAISLGFALSNYIQNHQKIQYTTVSIPDGQMGNVVLPDGSEVSLNSGSTLRYPHLFRTTKRDVYFSGEAYFKVKSDKSQPFFVHLDEYIIQVTGTSFNVRSYADQPVETTLIEGKVNIINYTGKDLANLLPNQMFHFNIIDHKAEIRRINPEIYTMWKEGKLLLNNENLGEIAEKLERWYHVQIEFTDERIKQKRITGTILKSKPFDQIIKILAIKESLNYHIQVRTDAPDIITFSLN